MEKLSPSGSVHSPPPPQCNKRASFMLLPLSMQQVCRRAERSVVALARSTTSEDSDASTTSRMNTHSSSGEAQTAATEGNAPALSARGSGEEAAQAGNKEEERSQAGGAD
eukprot:scaffold104137_cov19-Tisochrysis_lutea.AAC.1